MSLVEGDIESEVRQVFRNLAAVARRRALPRRRRAADRLPHGPRRFRRRQPVMEEVLKPPYPARATVQVAALPKGARVEVDAVLVPGN
jgi:hypothetical protein